MNTTINYYNLNAKNFIENTQNADMHLAQEKFLQLLPGSASILDFGCGSGRDTKYFLEKGYQVAATDGSAELCRLAGSFTGIKTKEGTIYHAGDLNDWYWDGEPKADNQRLTSAYHVEIRKIKGMHFDAAFVPLDPRQGDHYADGILYFLKNIDCNVIFPMHYWNDANVIKRFITEYPQYKSRIKNTECTKGEEL